MEEDLKTLKESIPLNGQFKKIEQKPIIINNKDKSSFDKLIDTGIKEKLFIVKKHNKKVFLKSDIQSIIINDSDYKKLLKFMNFLRKKKSFEKDLTNQTEHAKLRHGKRNIR